MEEIETVAVTVLEEIMREIRLSCLFIADQDRVNILGWISSKVILFQLLVQLNKFETDPHFLQNFQSNKTVCLIIHVFCKSCEPVIVLLVL